MKPGYKTTQFWLVLLLAILPALQQAVQAVLHALPETPAGPAPAASLVGAVAAGSLGLWFWPALGIITYVIQREASYRHLRELVAGQTAPDNAAK